MPDLFEAGFAWYCLKALPKKEHLAAVMLRREAQIEALAPRIRYVKKTRTGKKAFVEPLFPGYVFVQTALGETYRRIMATHGIRGVVSYGERVPALPENFITELKARLPEDVETPLESPEPALKVGQTVTVTEGPFANWEGMISGLIPAKARVKVFLEFLGQQLDVDLPAHALLVEDKPARSKLLEG